jgi:hypothetical protein
MNMYLGTIYVSPKFRPPGEIRPPGGHLGKATISAVTPELMLGSTPNFNHRYIYLLGIFYGFVTRGEHYGPGHFIPYSFEVDNNVFANIHELQM